METSSKRYVASGKPRGKARRRNRVASAVAGMIWPQRSLISHRELAGPGALEPELWSKLRFMSEPLRKRCGMQFEIAVEPGEVCAACIADPPADDRARAALIYGEVSRDLVLGLKYQGRRDGLVVPGGWMAGAGAELVAEADLIVPVPLQYVRLVRRGVNQSDWLAAALARSAG